MFFAGSLSHSDQCASHLLYLRAPVSIVMERRFQDETFPARMSAHRVRAICNSSSVRITRTVTLLLIRVITGAEALFDTGSSSIPRYFRSRQILARIGAEFSPIPPENTRVSNPPRAALSAPIHFRAW